MPTWELAILLQMMRGPGYISCGPPSRVVSYHHIVLEIVTRTKNDILTLIEQDLLSVPADQAKQDRHGYKKDSQYI